jgi:hypothetical protein
MPLIGTIEQRHHFDDVLVQPAGTPARQAERYMVSRVIARLGCSMTYTSPHAHDYGSRNPSADASSADTSAAAGAGTIGAVGIGADSVQKATSYRGSVHSIARQSPVLDSTYQYIPPDDPNNRSPRVTTYALDGAWYVAYLRKGLTETASRYRIDTEHKKRLNLKRLQADVQGASPAQKRYIRACSTQQVIDEAAYQQMIEEALQMSKQISKRPGWIPSDYHYVAQLYRCILTIQRQTIRVDGGQRLIQVSYTGSTTGRIYTRGSGLQSLPRYYKAQLLPGTNYDLKSAHDMILRYLFDRYGVPCPTWPDKDDIDLPNRLVKPISHAIKQVGAYQIPNHPKHCYAMKQQGCDVAQEIVAYCNATGTLVEPVLDTLHAAFDGVEHAIAELESRIKGHVGEHPLDMPLQEDKGKVAWLLQGYEAAIVLPICEALGSALVLADHDGFIVNETAVNETAVDETIVTGVVPPDLQPFVDLRQKPLYGPDDVAKVRRLTGEERGVPSEVEPSLVGSSPEVPSQAREDTPSADSVSSDPVSADSAPANVIPADVAATDFPTDDAIPSDLYFQLHRLYDQSGWYPPGTRISSRIQSNIDALERQLSPGQLQMIRCEQALRARGTGQATASASPVEVPEAKKARFDELGSDEGMQGCKTQGHRVNEGQAGACAPSADAPDAPGTLPSGAHESEPHEGAVRMHERSKAREMATWVLRQETHQKMLLGPERRIDPIADAHAAADQATYDTKVTAVDWLELVFVITTLVTTENGAFRKTVRVPQIRERLSEENAYQNQGIATADYAGYIDCHGRHAKMWNVSQAVGLLWWVEKRWPETS